METGLIRDPSQNVTSRQCDLLIHDCWTRAPLYRYDDFVIVHSPMARGVVEVKSDLDKSGIEGLLDVQASTATLEGITQYVSIPTLGYGLKGAKLDTIAEHLSNAIGENRVAEFLNIPFPPFFNWPACVAVQEECIFGVRPICEGRGPNDNRPCCFCLVDLNKATNDKLTDPHGIETGLFLYFYSLFIERRRELLTTTAVYEWFNRIPLSDDGKVWITPDGQRHSGNIAF